MNKKLISSIAALYLGLSSVNAQQALNKVQDSLRVNQTFTEQETLLLEKVSANINLDDVQWDSLVVVRPDYQAIEKPGDSAYTAYYGTFKFFDLDTLPGGLLPKINVKNLNPSKLSGLDLAKSYFNRIPSFSATRTTDSVEVTQTSVTDLLKNNCNDLQAPVGTELLESKAHVETLPNGDVVQGKDYIAAIVVKEKLRPVNLKDILTKYNKIVDFTQLALVDSSAVDSVDKKTKSISSNLGFSLGGFSDMDKTYGFDFRVYVPLGKRFFVFSGFRIGDSYTINEVKTTDNISEPVTGYVHKSYFSLEEDISSSTNNFLPVGLGVKTNNDWRFGLEAVVGKTNTTIASQILQRTEFIPTGEIVTDHIPVGDAEISHRENYSLNKVGLVLGKTFKNGVGVYSNMHYDLNKKNASFGAGFSYIFNKGARSNLPANKRK